MSQPIIELDNVDVALNGTTILRGITWQLFPGEQWAILGGNGSGKSTFLKLVRGDAAPAPGKGERTSRLAGVERTTAVGLRRCVSIVSPELHDRYLREEWRLTATDVIHSGFLNGDYVYQPPTTEQKRFATTIVDLLGIADLMQRNCQCLSTGELRKVLIGRALVGKPRVLALDEICDGLDTPSRSDLLASLDRIARSGTQMLFATHRTEELFPAISHTLLLDGGRLVMSGPRPAAFQQRGRAQSEQMAEVRVCGSNHRTATTSEISDGACGSPAGGKRTGVRMLKEKGANGQTARTLLRIDKANVYLERKKVLHSIDWEIRSGENWAVIGPNGAGKSTLLKLAFGDLQAAWGSRVSRLEFTAKNTIWQIRNRIGYIGPELQAHYRRNVRGEEVVGSGFYSSIGLHRRLTRENRQTIRELLTRFGADHLARKSAEAMSYGELRKMLLLRALVQKPAILISDEPFDGLDQAAKGDFRAALDQAAWGGACLIVVTHHVGDLPESINRGLLLEDGRVIMRGHLEDVRAHPLTQRLLAGVS